MHVLTHVKDASPEQRRFVAASAEDDLVVHARPKQLVDLSQIAVNLLPRSWVQLIAAAALRTWVKICT